MSDHVDPAPASGLPEGVEAALFAAHFAHAGACREAALQRLCAGHPQHADALRRAWRRLGDTDSLLHDVQSALPPAAAPPATPPPLQFGPYELVRLLGQGGFGEVWLAEQQAPMRRRVALKLLAPHRIDDQAAARFERERHALARLQHENVARVLDAGVGPGGRSFVVMEYVDGPPLSTYCDRQRLDVRARLQLFLAVCAGVHHAHQKGVLHRDLKPTNILVATADGRAVPKIIDFGVAKALHGELSDRTGLTEHGRLLGTPEYMSPEQAAGGAVDTRADVYSLGVVLFELLTGLLPFPSAELRAAGVLAAARLLAERPAPRPSEQLAREPGRAAAAAGSRGTSPQALLADLRADLDWIVACALAKSPDERYPSVTTLAADVQRFLAHQPLAACPPSRRYLLRKFVVRHRAAVLGAGALLVLVVAGLCGALWGLLVVDEARAVAVRERGRAEAHAYAAEIATAHLALRSGDAVGGRLHLERSPAGHRGFEWRYLAARCGQEEAVFPAYRALDLVALPDGRRVVGCGFDGSVRVHDVASGAELAQLRGTGVERRGLALDRGGERIAVVSPSGALEVLAIATGERLLDMVLHHPDTGAPLRLRAVSFAPDGRTLLTAGEEGLLQQVGPQGEVLRSLATGQRWIRAIDCSPVAARCITAAEDGAVVVWDTATWAPRRRLQAHAAVAVFDARFAPDGATFASCAADGTVKVWGVDDAGDRPRWSRDTGAKLLRLRFSPDGALLAIAGGYRDSHLEVLDAATGRTPGPLLGHAEGVEAVAFLPGGQELVTSGYDGTLRKWRVAADRWYRRLSHDAALVEVVPTADGTALAVVSQGGRLSLFDAGTLTPHWTVATGAPCHAVVVDEARERIVVLHADGLSAWARGGGEAVGTRSAVGGSDLRDLAPIAGGERFLLAAASGLLVADADSLRVLRRIPLPGAGTTVAAGSGAAVATTENGWLVCLQPDLAAERWRVRVGTTPGRHDCAIDPTGTRIAVGLADGRVALFDAAHGREQCRLDGHRESATVAWSPDGRRLATAGPDRRVKVIDPVDGFDLLTLDDAPYPAVRPVFAPDGNALYCCATILTGDSLVLEWRAPPQVSLR